MSLGTAGLQRQGTMSNRHCRWVKLVRMLAALVLRSLQAIQILIPFIVLMRWDPFYYVFRLLFCKQSSFVFEYFVRVGLSSVALLVFSRTISQALVFVFILCECCIECVQLLLTSSNISTRSMKFQGLRHVPWSWIQILRSLSDYKGFLLLFNLFAKKFLGNNIVVGIASVTVVFVTSGFATIRLVRLVPMPYYLLFPVSMVFVYFGTFIWFPYGVKVNYIFKQVVRNWYFQINEIPKSRRKLLLKEVNGIKVGVVAVMIGDYTFSDFEQGTPAGCFRRSLEYLITACLSIHV
jgi:hypothetical protein